jgi:hypothetical protein
VNVLVNGETYNYVFEVTFGADCRNIAFSSEIRNENGVRISTAGMHLSGKSIDVKEGERYTIQWKFNCKLLKGNYFTNTGIVIENSGVWDYLARVTDALAFKVIENQKSMYAGLVTLDQEITYEITNRPV